MKHYDEDTLLKYQLELLDVDELMNLKIHLTSCEICKTKLDEIKNEINLISSYNPEIEDNYIPVVSKRNAYSVWLKRAAVLLIGFVTGYSTSVFIQPDQVVVVGQYLNTKRKSITLVDYAVCPNIDIYRIE